MSTVSDMADQQVKPDVYKSSLKPVWCPGCGDYGVLNALCQAFARLKLKVEDTMIVSGIGCSSRLPGYLHSYGFNAVHGRALPIAIGAKLANHKLNVIAAGGDGDGFSIGIGHFPHACRRNVDITYIVMDNQVYGLTKGQLSPTSPDQAITSTSKYGSIETPIDPIRLALGCEAPFIARGFAGDIKHLVEVLVRAIKHRGFSFVQILSPCVTYVGKQQFIEIKQRLHYLDQDPEHDCRDIASAVKVINEQDVISVGIIRCHERPHYQKKLAKLNKAASRKKAKLEDLLDTFRP
ncbi:MAG: 2-oxoacid:ferredoxin oxidoreductase subunit beta [Candidatus Glassbacteria bacterium]|nr:2-oxoacid:ferredoxin oxidoreductase subunit beta [Candidatus Glassbacteria bacterium]